VVKPARGQAGLLGRVRDGTCVVLVKPDADVRGQAAALLSEWGPVHVASPAGDLSVTHLKDAPGVVVTCHHPDILTYVEACREPDRTSSRSDFSAARGGTRTHAH